MPTASDKTSTISWMDGGREGADGHPVAHSGSKYKRDVRSPSKTYDTTDVAFDAAVAVVTVRVGASAVFARHRTGLDPAAAAAQALHAAAIHTKPVLIAREAPALKTQLTRTTRIRVTGKSLPQNLPKSKSKARRSETRVDECERRY